MDLITELITQIKELRNEVLGLKRREQPVAVRVGEGGEIIRQSLQKHASEVDTTLSENAIELAGIHTDVAGELVTRAENDEAIRAGIEQATGVRYLFLDTFRNDEDPLTFPRMADIGAWTGINTENKIRVDDHHIYFEPPVGVPSFLTHVLWGNEAYPRIMGRAFIFHVTPTETNKRFRAGLDSANNRTPRTHAVYFQNTGVLMLVEESVTLTSFAAYIAGIPLDFAVVLFPRGAHYLMKPRSATTWNRLHVTVLYAIGPVYPFLTGFDATWSADEDVEVRDLAAPWDTPEADSLLHLIAPAAGTYVALDNGEAIIVWTAVLGLTVDVRLRWTDNNNCLVFRMNQGASTVAIVSRIAGVETTPGASNTKTFSFVPDTQYLFAVRMNASAIQVINAKTNTLVMGPLFPDHLGVININTSASLDELWFWKISGVVLPTLTRRIARQDTFWISSVTGNDRNSGLTPTSPVKTLDAALGRATGTNKITCYMEGPVTNAVRSPMIWTQARLVTLVPKTPGTRWYMFASQKHTAGWTSAGGGVWTKTITEFFTEHLQHVIVTSLADADGDELQLTYVAGTTTPAAGECSWNSVTFVCYVHLPADADPNTHTIETPLANYGLIVNHTDCVFEIYEGEFRYANISNVVSNGGTLIIRNTNAAYAITGNFAIVGSNGGTLDIDGGITYKCKNDNISGHGDLLGPQIFGIVRNHHASRAGDEDISFHEWSDLLVEDCELDTAGTGGITSVNRTHQVIRRTHIHDNMRKGHHDNWGGASFYGEETSGSVEDCIIENNDGPGIYATAGTPVTVINTLSGTANGNTDPDDLAGSAP